MLANTAPSALTIKDASKELLSLKGVSCIAWNADFSMCALSQKDWEVYIYETTNKNDVSSWRLLHTLKSHLQYVSCLDWHPKTNKIISGSYDKNLFVWSYNPTDNVWLPELVTFSSKGAILDVKWSERGDKFAVSTGNKIVATGYWEEEVHWWTCKPMKEHKSAVTTARFDNSGLFIISGSTDLKAYVSSAYLPWIDDKYTYESLPFEKQAHGEILYKFNLDSWANEVAWSPSSNYIVVSSQDATLSILNTSNQSLSTLNLRSQPITKIAFINETSFIGIAYDRHFYLFVKEGEDWKMTRDYHSVDKPETPTSETPSKPVDTSNMSVADRIKAMQTSGGKKTSIMVTNQAQTPKNIHMSHVNSAFIMKDTLITSDYSGFIKTLSLK